MKTINLSIEDFSELSYALIKQEEVIADKKFDGHMYSDTENKITMGIGFNIEANGILPIICAKKMNLLVSSSVTKSYILSEILVNQTDEEVINKVVNSISSVIQEFHNNKKIQANDKQDLALTTSQLTREEVDYINRSIQTTPSSKEKKQNNQQAVKQDIRHGATKHSRALQLEKAVNKQINDTITQINSSKQYTKQYEPFELILTSEEAKEIFIFLSRRFHRDLINSLLSGKNGLKVFKDGQFNEYSKLIISFLCGHYQMPAKFNKYNDPTDFFYNAVNKNNSRFLTWFGIRYYIDLVSASKDNQYNNYIKRRLHEAAVFELVERKENGTIDMYQTSKDIFTHLNVIFKFIKADDNVPLYGYKNKTFLEFIKTHHYSRLIDKIVVNKKNIISFSALEEYSAVLKNVTKIQELKNCLQDSMSIDEDKYYQSILDFAVYEDIFKPFLLYINEKFSKNILNIDFKLNEIYVVSNPNLKEFQNPVKEYFNNTSAEQKNILLISQLNWGMHQRFDELLDEYEHQTIILYLLKNKEHVLTMDNISKNNFRILLYDDNESINAVVLAGKYILINDDNDEKILYQHEERNEIKAEYLPDENIFTIIHQETKVSLRNFFPSKFHAGIILSNQEEIKEEPTAVSQVGEINITIELQIDKAININDLDKKKYYLFNTKTNELIDGIIEVSGDKASVSFKINTDADDISNTKLIFGLNKEDFSDKKEANTKFHDTAVIDKSTRDSKQTTTKASVREKDIKGVITGVELVEPAKENLPDINSYMETDYKFKATTSGEVNTDNIKWCYAVLTNSEYRGKVKVSTVSESISQTGEEIRFKPKDILSESSKEKLENKNISAKLYIFAYMKSPAYNTKHGKTHVECGVKRDLSNIQISDKDWHDPLDNMQIAIFMQSGGYAPYWAGFGYVRNGSTHQGIDLFAIPGTSVYACLEGTIYSMSELKGYGKTIILKITSDSAIAILNKRKETINYQLLYPKIKHTVNNSIIDGEQAFGPNYDENSNVFYIYYAHLDKYATDISVGSKVKAGDIIGATGTTGIDETKSKHKGPHLHFEITTQITKGLTGRVNPSFFIQYDIPTNTKYTYNSCIDYTTIKKNINDYLPTYSKQLEYRENN